ncbi:hypothetical protein TNCV_4704931 [Trichonephila clavipes]|nr:hypothetical protein TNCV_4704931 [Trichonephila clavipes]
MDGDVQKLLDSHNQELTIDELIEMHEQEQIEELESIDPVQSENRMTVGNWMEGIGLIGYHAPLEGRAPQFEKHCFIDKNSRFQAIRRTDLKLGALELLQYKDRPGFLAAYQW